MFNRNGRWTMVLVAALALGLLASPAAFADEKTDAAKAKVEKLQKEGYWGDAKSMTKHGLVLGKPMPKLELSDWIGTEIKPEDMKGKILIIDYWATWCGPCIAGIPHNNEVYKKYKPKGVELIGVCGGGGEEKMADVVEKRKIEYPTAKVSPASTKEWQVQWWPTYAIVDREGVVRALGIKPDYVDKIVDALIEEQGDKPKSATAKAEPQEDAATPAVAEAQKK